MSAIPVMKPWLGPEEAEAAAETVLSGWVAQGPRVGEFESRFATHVGAEHAVATSSCTTALHLGLVVAGIGAGAEVIVPSLSFIATANAVRYVGAEPVFADVDLSTGNLTAATVEPLLTPRTRAIIVVHQGGMPADVESLRSLLADRDVLVFEDAACAAGSSMNGQPVGNASQLAAWSFHPRKLLTTGEGGMLTTDTSTWAADARRLREHGMSISAAERHSQASRVILEQYLDVGFNYRMTDIQASVGLVQLRKLTEMVDRRRTIVATYRESLRDVPGLVPIHEPAGARSNYQSFWVRLADPWPLSRNDTLQALADRGILARRGIMAAHLEPAYSAYNDVELPATRLLTDDSLILPVFHQMSEQEISRVIDALSDLAAA